MKDWIILKIYSKKKSKDGIEAIHDIWNLGDKFRPILENLDKTAPSFHAYYSDDEKYPEGPHFKFFVRTKKANLFLDWKKKNEKCIKKIDQEFGNDGQEMKECMIAGRIFQRVKNLGKKNLSKLKRTLKEDEDFRNLWEKARREKEAQTGIHFLCLMFKMLEREESSLYQLLNENNK